MRLLLISLFFLYFSSHANTQVQQSERPSEIFHVNDQQLFKLKFIDTTAGECLLETLAQTTWEGRPAHHFRATFRTVGFFKFIYPFVQVADIYFDREKAVPLIVDINTRDRKKVAKTQIRLDVKTLKGQEFEESTEPDRPFHKRHKLWNIEPGAQSLFTILYYLRMKQMNAGSQIEFPVSHDEKNGIFKANVVGLEPVKLPRGERPAVVVRISREFLKSFRPSIQDEPTLWFSNDQQKKLLKFEFKHRLGKIFAVLDESYGK